MDDAEFDDEFLEDGEEEEEDLDPNNPDYAFAMLERNFNRTVAEIESNPEASQFLEEFYKLFENVFQTHQKLNELQERYEILTEEVYDKTDKLEIAQKLTFADQTTINDLKTQIEHAWKLADAAHAREQAAQEMIDNLRKQVETLNAEIEFKNRLGGGDASEEFGQVTKKKEGLERENEKLTQEVQQLTQKLHNALEYQVELERVNSSADLRIVEIAGQLEENEKEIDKQKMNKAKLENDVAQLQYKIEDRDVHVNNLNSVINENMKEISNLESKIKDDRIARDKLNKELDNLSNKYGRLVEEHENAMAEMGEVKKYSSKKSAELKALQEQYLLMKNDYNKTSKQKDLIEKRIYGLESEKNELLDDRNKLRQRIGVFEKEIENCKKSLDAEKRQTEGIIRERDMLGKTIIKQEGITRDQEKLIKIQQQSKKKLEDDIELLTIENHKFKKIASTLERERDRLHEQHIELGKKIEDAMDDIKVKKTEIYDLKKSISEQEARFKMQQNLFDALRADKSALQKALQESNSQAGELKKKIKITSHQIEQLKEDISGKEQVLIKHETIFKKVLKEKEVLKVDLNTALDNIKSLKVEIGEKNAEEKRLHKQILDNERVIKDQKNDLEQLMNERDILGSQLVRRNDEIALLHEKIRIFQATLQRGESQYMQRLEDIRLLKIEIKRLRQEKNLMAKTIKNSVDLKQEVLLLERDLTSMRLKCRALEEELQNPLNIHRWRKLEGSDPDALEMLQKIQILQKRLLKQSSEAIDREKQLKELEKSYLNLKKLLKHQPGPGIQQELSKTQRALKLRNDKLKCLVAELNMTEVHATEYKSDLQRVSDDLKTLKKSYFAQKKANRTQQLAHISNQELDRIQNRQSQVKIAGGGYRMSSETSFY